MQLVREARRPGTPVKIGFFLVTLLASVIFITGCGGDEQAQEDPEEQNTRTQSTEQDTNAQRTEDTGMENGKADEGSGQEVTLKIEGDPGTEFSGVCDAGDREEDLAGEVPESFVYELSEGQTLDCEIRKSDSGAGALKVTLTAPGNNVVQQTNTPGGSINLSFSGSGVTSSTSTSSNSVVQQSSSSSNSVVQQNSSSFNSVVQQN